MNLPGEGQLSGQPQELQELLHGQKVGRCVNGVAHDVNNCLGAILAYAELTSLDPRLEAEPRRMVGKIIDAVERASTLVTELTNVARPVKSSQGVIDFRQLLKGLLLIREYDHRINQIVVEQQLPEALPSVAGDVAQMRLALLYLILNAEEALQHAAPRKLTITVAATAEKLTLALLDTAPPIDDAVQARMFDPGFTTKGGAHLGLGLGVARAIVAAEGGTLEYCPEAGFVLEIPFPPHPTDA